MTFKQFMDLYDDWNGYTKVNDDDLHTIVRGKTSEIMYCMSSFSPKSKVKSYGNLFAMEVVSFGFYDNELCVRVK